MKDRDRLLQSSTRTIGLSSLAVSILCLAIPGVVSETTFVATLPLYFLVALSLFRLGSSSSILWVIGALVAGFGVMALVISGTGSLLAASACPALIALGGGAMASCTIVLLSGALRITVLAISALVTVVLMQIASSGGIVPTAATASVLLGWILAGVFGWWARTSIPLAHRRIEKIGKAHRAERSASEAEAQRRQSARLLHDTVLATLTLLAHSGVGVSHSALRHQAGDDAQLLRQLRLGASLPAETPLAAAAANDVPSGLGNTLESVKHRFERIGLHVSWHGTGQVLLQNEILDAFLLALAECLENVRRHSGVTDAHVTITDDDTTVRAMVTDAGVGFVVDDIDPGRLGYTDSIVGRLREVGGNARLFSSPGAGTTVVLEVPR